MLLALCDDDALDVQKAAQIINDYQVASNTSVHCTVFSSPQALAEALEQGARFDGFLLDILMPGMDGIQLARAIHAHTSDAPIAYLTSTPEYALEAYQVKAARYLTKPVKREELYEALEFFLRESAREEHPRIALRTAKGLIQIDALRVLYAESKLHTVLLTLAGQTEPVCSTNYRCPFAHIVAPLLQRPEFLRVHNSFVINLDRVKGYDSCGFTMENGALVPVSQKYRAEVKQQYLNYFEMHDRL